MPGAGLGRVPGQCSLSTLSPLLSSTYSGKVPQEEVDPGVLEFPEASGGADNGMHTVSGSQGGWVWACQEAELEEAQVLIWKI